MVNKKKLIVLLTISILLTIGEHYIDDDPRGTNTAENIIEFMFMILINAIVIFNLRAKALIIKN